MRKRYVRLKTLYSNLRIKHKMFVLITTLMLTMCICCLAVFQYVFDVYDKEMYTRSSQALNVASFGMDNELIAMEQLTYRIATDQNVQSTLRLVRDNTSNYDFFRVTDDLNKRMLELGVQDKYILSVHTFDIANREYRSGMRPNQTDPGRLEKMKQLTSERQGGNTWILPDEFEQTLIAAREIRDYSNFEFVRLGTLAVRIDMQKLVQDYAQGLDRQGAHFLILNDGEPLFSGELPVRLSALQQAMSSRQGYEIIEEDNRRYFMTFVPSAYTNWDYIIFIPYDEQFQAIANVKRIVLILFSVIFVVTIALSIRYARTITRPIESLNAKMKIVQKGNFDLASVSGDEQFPMDETGQMHRNFRIMISRINDLINENYRKQLAMKESEYKALQAQINPHFLYNTLESINWQAKVGGQKQISQMVEALAYLMRSSINQKEPLVRLAEEKTFILHYITIQKLRFEERLDFRMDIPEDLESCVVPKLVLQPIVENAIQYALEKMINTCTIEVKAEADHQVLRLIISDNGPGMSKEDVQQIFDGKLRSRGTGIGIRNIHDRIRLMFGEPYGLSIESEVGSGTWVTISIPKNARDAHV